MKCAVVWSLVVWGSSFCLETAILGQSFGFSTVAGIPGSQGSSDGTNHFVQFARPGGIAVDGAGNCYVADTYNHTIRRLTRVGADWVGTTIAGSAGLQGTADGSNSVARFYYPYGVTVDGAGNLYVADTYNHTIRKLARYGADWAVTTLAGTVRTSGSGDGTGSGARFNYPSGIAADGDGNVFVADTYNQTIRRVTPAGVVTTAAGSPGIIGIADGMGATARFQYPYGLAVFGSEVFVADTFNHTLRRLLPFGTDWLVSTIAGLPTYYGSDNGTNQSALFDFPFGIAADSAGDLYIADNSNQTIRKLTPIGTDWVSSTLGGSVGVPGSADGVGPAALFNFPRAVAVDPAGNLFVADTSNQTIRFGQFGFLLHTLLAGGQMILSWSAQATNYSLETSASLAPGAAWTRLDTDIFLSGTDFVRTNTVGAGPAFFRLRQN